MNTAIVSQVGQSAGISFAVPINSIARILDQLIQNGRVIRADLGIYPRLRDGEGLLVVASLKEGRPSRPASGRSASASSSCAGNRPPLARLRVRRLDRRRRAQARAHRRRAADRGREDTGPARPSASPSSATASRGCPGPARTILTEQKTKYPLRGTFRSSFLAEILKVETWYQVAVLSVGGVLGVNARFWLGVAINRWTGSQFPWATFTINVTGSFAIGLCTAVLARWLPHPHVRLLVVVGFLGGYTTFSSYSLESLLLWERGERGLCLAYLLGSVVAGFAAVVLGTVVGRGLQRPELSSAASRSSAPRRVHRHCRRAGRTICPPFARR